MTLPPIQPGEVHIRCPQCRLIGWTEDGEPEEMPDCPRCGVRASRVAPDAKGRPDIRIIDGAPADPSHHLRSEYMFPPARSDV